MADIRVSVPSFSGTYVAQTNEPFKTMHVCNWGLHGHPAIDILVQVYEISLQLSIDTLFMSVWFSSMQRRPALYRRKCRDSHKKSDRYWYVASINTHSVSLLPSCQSDWLKTSCVGIFTNHQTMDKKCRDSPTADMSHPSVFKAPHLSPSSDRGSGTRFRGVPQPKWLYQI